MYAILYRLINASRNKVTVYIRESGNETEIPI